MLGMIETLETNGYAYRRPTATSITRCASSRTTGSCRASRSTTCARASVAANDAKEDPLDFVLWKRAKPEDPEGTSWASKYGMGRPGWHIECSAMGCTLLGEHFDIHGGGQDLHPHHENEIAQSEGATGQTFVNYWMHNGFVQVDNEKMSKSLGNFFTIREVLERYDAEVMRFIVRTHYRSPLIQRRASRRCARVAHASLYRAERCEADTLALDWNEPHAQRFAAAMNDDFNTPVAVATLFELAGEVNRTGDASLARQLKQLAGLLGLLGREPRAFCSRRPAPRRRRARRRRDRSESPRVSRRSKRRTMPKRTGSGRNCSRPVSREDKPGGSTEWRRV